MNMLDNYVAEVGQHLPRKNRTDIEAEIRSLLEDTLEDRSRAAGREPDEEMTVEILKQFGSPEKVAASYLPEKYLIGPQLFPAFRLVLQIVLTIVIVLGLIGLAISVSQVRSAPGNLGETVFNGLLGLASGAMQTFGNIVLIFAIMQWVYPELKIKMQEEKWDPLTLKGKDPADTIKPIGALADIGFTLAVVILFNFYPQYIGIGNLNGSWKFVSVLTPTFFHYLPWINLVWFTTIALDIILVRQGKWQPWTRWFAVAKTVLAILVLLIMLSGDPIAQLTAEGLARIGWPQSVKVLPQLINLNVKGLLGLFIFLEGFDLVKTLYHLLVKKHSVIKL
jgi:hypothetical protein